MFKRLLRILLGRHSQLYRSELDQFIHDFESQRTTEPESRRATRLKHDKIARARDGSA